MHVSYLNIKNTQTFHRMMQRVEVLHMFFRMTEPQRAVAWLAKVDPWYQVSSK